MRASVDPTCLNAAQRQRDLERASTGTADLLVIGGGVTGAGVALDAAARGLRVVLVEAGDIAHGCSSRSGKAFHGGLRYLEQLNFKLVAHAIAERDLMLKTLCPHMAWPEAFVYPMRHPWERPYVGAGVLLYDLFGLPGGAVPRQRHFSRRGLKAHMPSIDDQLICGGIQYYDALMDDARHTLAVARTAAGLGAAIITGAPVVEFIKGEGGAIQGVVVQDTQDGQRHALKARAVVNAAGVWADDLQQLAGANSFRVRAAKGAHLLLRPEAIQADAGLLARATDSVIIARRWYGYWLVGTTDTPCDKGSAPVAEVADIHYLLYNLNRYLSQKITPADVLGTYAGMRPLLKPVDGVNTTSALSRDHSVISGPNGLTTVVGGKYTTYRRMALDAVDAALKPLGIHTPSRTHALPLVGAQRGADFARELEAIGTRYALPAATMKQLCMRHGDRVGDVLALTHARPELLQPLDAAPRYLAAELLHAVISEGARTLTDVMVRRTHLSIELADGGQAIAAQVAALIAPQLNWRAEDVERETLQYLALVQRERAALNQVRASFTEPEHRP